MNQPAPQTQDGLVGQVIQDLYFVEALIATGGMGSIYRARHQRLGRPVAVKILKKQYSEDEKAVKRFLREALAVSQLHHPHTVQVLDEGQTTAGIYYIVMEYLEGESVDRRIARDGTLPLDVAMTFVGQACAALGEAHRKGIVHRDLKPANMFIVRADGVPEFVKLLDFGIAKFYTGRKDGQELTKLTTAGSTMGTPHYMAPEQIRGEEIDGRADIYSMGIILWEALVGKPPFNGDSPMEIFLAHLEEKLPKLTELAPHLPHELEKILRKALSKSASDRYGTMEAFKQALDGLLFKSGMIAAPTISAAYSGPMPRVSSAGMAPAEKVAVTRPSFAAVLKKPTSLAIAGASLLLLILIITIIVVATGDPEPSEAEPADTAAVSNAANMAHIKLHSDPSGATVLVGTEPIGSTPLYLQYDRVEGAMRFEIRADGCQPQHFTLVPTLGEVVGVMATLREESSGPAEVDKPMFIVVKSIPSGAQATIKKDGKEPITLDTPVRVQAESNVEVILEHEGFAVERFRVPVVHGETVTVSSELVPLASEL